tara:strand:- start:1474 stop:2070 length:597 start_codon:yes stop_codon:yes gene_type:complete
MLPLGTALPSFQLPVVQGTNLSDQYSKALKTINNKMLLEKPLLLMVICSHCPFVKHLELGISKIEEDYDQSIQIIALSSNSLITHPQDGPENLAKQANKHCWRFPYLLDLDQSFAKALKAACTPDFFLFSPSLEGVQELKYRGQFDESRPGNNIPVTGTDLRFALDGILLGKPLEFVQKPSIGCNIKWEPGNEPAWFG